MKICLLGGVWGNQEVPLFILGPPHISETNRARTLKFGTLVFAGTMAACKNLSARGRLRRSAAPSFYFGTHISVTNGARKLKFGTFVDIYAC